MAGTRNQKLKIKKAQKIELLAIGNDQYQNLQYQKWFGRNSELKRLRAFGGDFYHLVIAK